MSGGVDSSVAAALLKKEGCDVVGAHMKCFNVDGCAEQDVEDARRAAEVLDIPFYVFDFEKEYKEGVVEYMVDGYRKGITPNPDVMCNKEIKFGLFLKKALAAGADFIATGHYVRRGFRIQNLEFRKTKKSLNPKSYILYSARDTNKDQSYFLWTLTQEQLRYCLFPIGEYTKPQVRKLAVKFGLPNADKKDSQGICFLGKVALPDFLSRYIKPKKGNIIDTDGNILGQHNGAHFYTIGQRQGIMNNELRIKNKSNQKPFYVADKDIKNNVIVVAEGEDNTALYRKQINLTEVNLLNKELGIKNKEFKIPIMARVRYRQPLVPATFIIHNSRFMIQFKKPVKFVAEGQSAVFYDFNGAMLGGGIIK